jgi:hypothetical protein
MKSLGIKTTQDSLGEEYEYCTSIVGRDEVMFKVGTLESWYHVPLTKPQRVVFVFAFAFR